MRVKHHAAFLFMAVMACAHLRRRLRSRSTSCHARGAPLLAYLSSISARTITASTTIPTTARAGPIWLRLTGKYPDSSGRTSASLRQRQRLHALAPAMIEEVKRQYANGRLSRSPARGEATTTNGYLPRQACKASDRLRVHELLTPSPLYLAGAPR